MFARTCIILSVAVLVLSSCDGPVQPKYPGPPVEIWYGSSTLTEKFFTIKNPSDVRLCLVANWAGAERPIALLGIEPDSETTCYIDFVDGGIKIKGPDKSQIQFVALPDAEMEIEFKCAYQTPPVEIFRLTEGKACHLTLAVKVTEAENQRPSSTTR